MQKGNQLCISSSLISGWEELPGEEESTSSTSLRSEADEEGEWKGGPSQITRLFVGDKAVKNAESANARVERVANAKAGPEAAIGKGEKTRPPNRRVDVAIPKERDEKKSLSPRSQ